MNFIESFIYYLLLLLSTVEETKLSLKTGNVIKIPIHHSIVPIGVQNTEHRLSIILRGRQRNYTNTIFLEFQLIPSSDLVELRSNLTKN